MTRPHFFGRRGGKGAPLGNLGNLANVQQGATAHRTGRTFEDELEATNAAYRMQGLATIARAHPPVGGPPTALYYRGTGQVDTFDAKSNSDAASYKHDPRDYHELDFLLDWRRTRGVAFLILLDRPIGTLYLVDDLAALRAGSSIALRTHARGRSRPESIVPALRRTESEVTLDVALGRPVWPWLALAKLQYPTLAAAMSSLLPPAA
jgi:hypothetical protein